MPPSSSENEDVSNAPTSKKRVTRSSKRASIPVEISPRKKTPSANSKKNTKQSASKSTDETQTVAKPQGRGRGRPRSVLPDTAPQTLRGRGRGRTSRGKSNTQRGRGVKPGPKYFWGRAPPTQADLATLGAKDGCKYVLSARGRAGTRNKSTRDAEIAVANLYDSD